MPMQEKPITKPVIKIEMVGTVTSFRYHHFTQGMHPTFDMPPPSTIYGHICSAVGDWVDPSTVTFGYHFTHAGKFIDHKEHLHFGDWIQPFPFDRELLFNPRLTLYVEPIDLLSAFQRPHFSVVLGRSQDLMTYRSIKIIELQRVSMAYFEHTLLPFKMATRLSGGTITTNMARYVDQRRRSSWSTYTIVKEPTLWPPPPAEQSELDEEEGLIVEGDLDEIELWIDPDSPSYRKVPDAKRAIWLHRFVD